MRELKLIKGLLKKQVKFTISTLIVFLITGSLGYGIDEIHKDVIDITNIIEGEDNISLLEIKEKYNGKIISGNLSNKGIIITNLKVKGGAFFYIGNIEVENSGNGILGQLQSNFGVVSGEIIIKAGIDQGEPTNSKVVSISTLNLANGVLGDVQTNSGVILGKLTSIGGRIDVVSHATLVEAKSENSIVNSGNGILGDVQTNSGIILGQISSKNGVAIVTNHGISNSSDAKVLNSAINSGNGILGNIQTNSGIILGEVNLVGGKAEAGATHIGNAGALSSVKSEQSGNGILGDIKINTGVISGIAKLIAGTAIDSSTREGTVAIEYSGNGVTLVVDNFNMLNYGVVKGSENAISISEKKSIKNGLITNYGLLVGQNIIKKANDLVITYSNLGTTIEIDEDGIVQNVNINVKQNIPMNYTILNGYTDGSVGTVCETITGNTYVKSSNLQETSNLIINGVGTDNKGALTVDKDIELDNLIINGYETALSVTGNNKFTGTDVTFNGGGFGAFNEETEGFDYTAVIKGDTGNNTIEILGKSMINGDVDLVAGDNNLTIGNEVQINGNLKGGTENDILNLGVVSQIREIPKLNVFSKISGFEKINTNGNITLFEIAEITDAVNINLESGNLVLRVNPTVTVDGKVTGHALYGNDGTLTSNGGNLVIGLNGLGEGTIISMGGTTITPDTDDSWWKDTDHIKTNSLVLDGKLSTDGKDINITVLESIPLAPSVPPIEPEPPVNPPISPEAPIVIDSLLYEKLNKVYQSIVTSGEIGSLANTTLLENKTYNESLGGLLTLLDQMYANNPYTYTVKSSRDSLKIFEDNMSYLTIKPKKDEMIVQGKAIYTGVKNDNGAYGKNYYGFDTGHRNYKTTTNTVGGLATFEYGLSDKTSVGVVLGGNNQDINFKGSSKIKGNSLYLGTFAKTDINNFKFMGGVGYQYTSADADRKVSNRYDSFSTGDKYDINSLNAFVEAKYVYNAEQDWTVEPKVRLSYYYINQDKVNEGYTPRQISMRIDAVNSNTADVEIGVDFVKSLYLNNGKLKNILSLGVINTIGDKSKELNGYILGKEKDGKKFDIQGVELPKTSGKVSYNLELEQLNGMIYTTGVSMEFAKDYNRNINVIIGIGYKF